MKIDIPNKESFELKNIVFDYNGTIAIDGKIIDGVSKNIDELSNLFDFYVITADTYGSVENELKNTNCKVITISKDKQDEKSCSL